MKDLLNTLSSENYTISAVIVGLLLCQDLDNDQQELLGGWLMLVGQLIESNAGFASLQNEKLEKIKKAGETMRRQTEKQSPQQH